MPALVDQVMACRVLVESLPLVRVSAVAWMEFVRNAPAANFDAIEAIRAKTQIEPLTAPMAERAGKLLAAARKVNAICPRCYSIAIDSKCKDCGRVGSKQESMNDALILATAHELKDVDVLHSYDGGIAELAKFLDGRPLVVPPPNASGRLFDTKENPQLARLQLVKPSSGGG